MDFDLTDRQKHWQGRVREFVERKIRPAVPNYKEQDRTGDRWKVIHVVEDPNADAQAAGIWNQFMPPRRPAHPHVYWPVPSDVLGSTHHEISLCAQRSALR